MRAFGGITAHVSTQRHRAMKVGLVIQTAVALFLLLSPAQVGSEAACRGALRTGGGGGDKKEIHVKTKIYHRSVCLISACDIVWI